MLRATLMTGLALATLAPSAASADDCMCFAMPDLEQRTERRLQSLEVGPFFSSDGTMLTSRELELELERHFGGTPAGEILWCWSPNDPRCSPTSPSPDDAPRALRTGPSALTVDHRLRWPEIDDAVLTRNEARLLGPAEGVHARVERPPRG